MNSYINQLEGKNVISNIQLELEEKLKDARLKMHFALDRNVALERDLIKAKEELNKSLKWTTSSKTLDNVTNQNLNGGKDLDCVNKVHSYMSHSKYVNENGNFLCLQCGRNGHLKRNYATLKSTEGNMMSYLSTKQVKIKLGPAPKSRNGFDEQKLALPLQASLVTHLYDD